MACAFDCVLAHLADAHAWTPGGAGVLGRGAAGGLRRDRSMLHDVRIVAPIPTAVERLDRRLLHGRP